MASSQSHPHQSSSTSQLNFAIHGNVSDWYLEPANKIRVEFNAKGQALSSELSSSCGDVARMSIICPITVNDWRRIPKTNKEQMLVHLKEHFNIPDCVQKHVVATIGHAWKNYKTDLRREIDERRQTESFETISNNPSEKVNDLQWRQFVDNYFYGTGKDNWLIKTEKGRERRQQKELHTCGRKSFALKRKELEEKNGPIGDVEFYKVTHKKKDKTMNEYSTNVLDQCVARMAERNSLEANAGGLNRIALEEHVLREVRGPEHPGRVRGQGRGPTPSSMTINKIQTIASTRQDAQIERQQIEIAQQRNQIKTLEANVKSMEDKLQLIVEMNGIWRE